MPAMTAAKTEGISKKGKPRGIRHDRDCFTCRARNIKCDLNRPICMPCARDNVTCEGYPSRVVWAQQNVAAPPARRASRSQPKHESVVNSLPAPPTTVTTLTTPLVASVIAMSPPKPTKPDSPAPSMSSIHTLLSKSQSPPIVSPDWSESTPSNPSDSDSKAQGSMSTDLSPGMLTKIEHDPFACLSEGLDDDVDPMRITNFLWGVKAILAAFNHAKQTNTSMESRENIEKSKILSTIWKFVSACLDHNNTSLHSELTSLQVKAKAIEELQKFINDGVLEAIFSILAFTYLDVCQGSFGSWHRHLQGARSLLDVHCQDQPQLLLAFKNTPGLHHAVTLLNWYDITGVLACQNRSLIFEDWHRETIDNRFFSLVGCPKDIFFIFAELFKQTPAPLEWLGHALDHVLRIDPVEVTLAERAGNAWKYACLLTALERSDSDNSTFALPLDTLVGHICGRIASIPFDTALSQHMAVVVFIASRHAVRQEHRDVIRKYWSFWASEKFPLYPDALWACEQTWNRLDFAEE